MNKFTLLTFILFSNFLNLYAQEYFTEMNNVSLGCTISKDNYFYIIGDFGFISRSVDKGLNWNLLTSNTSRRLNSIISLSNNKLIIVGDYGVVLSSNDKGDTWKKITIGFNSNLKSVCAFDSLNILIVGDSGLILKSTDEGNHFSKVNSNTNDKLIKIKNSSRFSATILSDKGLILFSTDKGITWISKSIGLSGFIYDIDFLNEGTGTISTGSELFRTNDSGYNWFKMTVTDNSFFNSYPNIKYISNDSLISIPGIIKISGDSGKTWKETNDLVNLDQNINIRSIASNDGNCLMVGRKILVSNDNFKSNFAISKSTDRPVDLMAFDDTSLFIGAVLNRYGDRSFDMGLTWKTTNRSYLGIDKFIQISQDSAIAFSLNQDLRTALRAWVTGDKGNSWGYYESNFNLSDFDKRAGAIWEFKNISFVNRYNWILNLNRGPSFDIGNRTKNLLLYTKDAGLNWDTAKVDDNPNKEYSGLFLVNDKFGFASSRSIVINLDSSITTTNRIYKTIDGGMNWHTIKQLVSDFNDSIEFKNIFFKDSLEGFIVGQNAKNGAVLHHTLNGGIDWTTTQFKGVNSLNNVKFFNNNIGYLLGSQANLFSTSDGGKSWVKEKLWYEDLIDSTFNLEDIYIMPNRKTLFLKLTIGNSSFANIYRKTLTNQIPISSVNEQKNYNFISDISPNPTNNFVNIKCESFLNKEVDVKLFNAISEEVFSGKFINSINGISVNVSNIPNGFYNVIIKAGDKRSFQKVIVKH